MSSADIFVLLRAQGFDFLAAREPDAFAIGHMRYPTFIREGVRLAIQSGRCLGEDRGSVMIYDSDRTDVVVWGLRTDSEARRQGLARRVMRTLLDCADACDVTLFLEPVPLDKAAMTAEQLQTFYRTLGFQVAGGKGLVMQRAPQPPSALGVAASP